MHNLQYPESSSYSNGTCKPYIYSLSTAFKSTVQQTLFVEIIHSKHSLTVVICSVIAATVHFQQSINLVQVLIGHLNHKDNHQGYSTFYQVQHFYTTMAATSVLKFISAEEMC